MAENSLNTVTRCCRIDPDNSTVYRSISLADPIAGSPGTISGPANHEFNPALDETEVNDTFYLNTECGQTPLRISVTRTTTGGGVYLVTDDGRFVNNPGASDYILRVDILPDGFGNYPKPVSWFLRANGVNSTENIGFANQAVTSYVQGAQGINISASLPYTGNWHNSNNPNIGGAFGFDPSNSLTWIDRGANGINKVLRLATLDSPNAIYYTPCEIPALLKEECECAYELVEFPLDLGQALQSDPDYDFINFYDNVIDGAFYAPSERPFTFNGVDFDGGRGQRSDSIHFLTTDGEMRLNVKTNFDDISNELLVSSGYPFSDQLVSLNNTDRNLDFSKAGVTIRPTQCAVFKALYILLPDMDASGTEYFNVSNFTQPHTQVATTHTILGSNFTQTGDRYDPVGEDQFLIIKLEGDVDNIVNQVYEHGKDVNTTNNGNIYFGADYFRPLNKCGDDWKNARGEVVPLSEIFTTQDLIDSGYLGSDADCCSLQAQSPDFISANITANIPVRDIANALINTGQNINDNDVVDVTSQLTEGNWSATTEGFQYIGSPDYVIVNAQVNQSILQNANAQRPAPILNLEKLIGGVWNQVATSSTGYIRDASDHEQSSNTIFYRDVNPGANPEYRLSSGQESLVGSAVNVVSGQFDLEAVIL